jgi:long-chain acyl-CoA synthetase
VAPRVLNKIYDKIHNGIAAAGGVKKKLFDAALATKTRALQHGQLTHAVYDRLIFNKIKQALGMDHIRFMVSGSAPLSEPVMIFFRCMLGIPVVEGYGQTEGAATATIGRLDDMATVGHVGGPTPAVEVLLADVPEMGYLHTDTSHRGQPCQGRGEIWIRGPCVFKGYYKDAEQTAEMLDDEGWLHSGDIGLWTMEGNLQIIDRKKNIFKLSQGGELSLCDSILRGSVALELF